MNIRKYRFIPQYITTTALVVVILVLAACGDDNANMVKSAKVRDSIPLLNNTDVSTVISDSGITRYRINTPKWIIYDKAKEPYWDFPKGIDLERFDRELKVDAQIHANKAVYFERKQLWDLQGSVKATNLQGEIFETEHIFWDQRQERIYSEEPIKITQKDKIITGVGFESNQMLTKYVIKSVTGVFPFDEEEE